MMKLPPPLSKKKPTLWRYQAAAAKGKGGPRPKFEIEDNRKVPVTLPRVSIQNIPVPR